MDTPIQGHAALLVTTISVIITLGMLILGLRSEKKRPTDHSDDH